MSNIQVTVPCYNEAERLDVNSVRSFLAAHPAVSLVLVDDGSTDATGSLLRKLADELPGRVEAVILPANRGKAEAVRAGILHSLGGDAELVGYWDADLATPLEMIPAMGAQFVRDPELAMVCGCRLLRLGADVRRSVWRHLIGRGFATVASWLLKLPVYDTQCGAKLLRRDTAERLFREPWVACWLFDVELFFRFEQEFGHEAALRRILEFPLPVWHDVGGSRLTLRSAPGILLEFQRLARHFRRERR